MLDFESDYTQWKTLKLNTLAKVSTPEIITIQNPGNLSRHEYEAILFQCQQNNFALYRLQQPNLANKQSIRVLAQQLGMCELDQNLCADNDSISSLQVMNLGRAQGYIPYTSHALNWHTDGYYNALDQHIRSFLLHCVNPASEGGENMLINHELIYIHLYEQNPQLATALMQTDALTIPANIENNVEIRPQQSGPVFYRDSKTKTLQMRYTARSKSIEWKDDPLVLEAKSIIETLLQENHYVTRYQLNAGEGLVCNNILHGRTAFTNGSIPEERRLMYRIRSYDRLFCE